MGVRERLMRLMQGRYGAYGSDRLTRALLVLWLIVFIFGAFLPQRMWLPDVLSVALIIYTYWRLLSRNIPARYRENEAYLHLEEKVRARFPRLRGKMSQTLQYHIYRCPSCAQKIRIPRGKGRIIVRCPKCATEFEKRS